MCIVCVCAVLCVCCMLCDVCAWPMIKHTHIQIKDIETVHHIPDSKLKVLREEAKRESLPMPELKLRVCGKYVLCTPLASLLCVDLYAPMLVIHTYLCIPSAFTYILHSSETIMQIEPLH